MPRYDFKCRVCGEVFEAIASSDVTAMTCVVCPPQALQQVFTMSVADRQLSCPANIHIH